MAFRAARVERSEDPLVTVWVEILDSLNSGRISLDTYGELVDRYHNAGAGAGELRRALNRAIAPRVIL